MGRALIRFTEKDLGLKALQAFIEKYDELAFPRRLFLLMDTVRALFAMPTEQVGR